MNPYMVSIVPGLNPGPGCDRAQAAVLIDTKVLMTVAEIKKTTTLHSSLSSRYDQDKRKHLLPLKIKVGGGLWAVFLSTAQAGETGLCLFHHFRLGRLLPITPLSQNRLLPEPA